MLIFIYHKSKGITGFSIFDPLEPLCSIFVRIGHMWWWDAGGGGGRYTGLTSPAPSERKDNTFEKYFFLSRRESALSWKTF